MTEIERINDEFDRTIKEFVISSCENISNCIVLPGASIDSKQVQEVQEHLRGICDILGIEVRRCEA